MAGVTGWLRDLLWRWLAADRPNVITTSQELDSWIRFGGQATSSGIAVNVTNASGFAAVAACERALSNGVAQLPLQLFRTSGDSRQPAREESLYRVLHTQANGWQTSFQFRKLMMRDLLFRGNAYARKVWNRRTGEVLELIRLHPDSVKPAQDARTMRISYEYTGPDGIKKQLAREDVFHVWFHSDDGIVGLNPIQLYRETIGDGIAIRQHGSSFFANKARVGAVLETAAGSNIGSQSAKDLVADFDQLYTGADNAHRTAVLPGGITYKPISISMEDAQWIEARKTTAREICGIFGVPPHKIGDLERTTFANIESSMIEFVVDSLTPWLICWEQAIQRDLIPAGSDLFAKFNVSGLLRGDTKTRAEYYTKLIAARVMNPNEAREKEDMNPYQGGEEFGNPNIDPKTTEAPPNENQDPTA